MREPVHRPVGFDRQAPEDVGEVRHRVDALAVAVADQR